MTGVDDRIVSMKFDNESFQRKLGDTIVSLDKLRASLDLAGATRGLTEVDRAAKNLDMSNLGSAVDGISTKFLALSTVAITTLASITIQALRSASQISTAFTVAPVVSGFQEYETNMNSIQTILSNTRAEGTSLEQVNEALDLLNQYSDQTIYNFSQMARNIGTFTAAGVDLDTSVGAIKGIANLAAVSGSNAEQASSAMYQLSQALATGTLKLIDWNSVVNAGLGGEVFQRALFTTGQALGTLTSTRVGQTFDEWKEAGNSFRGSLEEGWITAEVLTNTLQGFTGDLTEAQIMAMGYTQDQAAEILALGADAKAAATQVKTFTQLMGTIKESIGSGWSASFRILVGNFEQARTLFTEINNAIGGFIGRSADARNEMLTAWADFGGRDTLIQAFRDLFEGIASFITPIRDAFRDIFPPATAATLLILTRRFADFAAGLAIGEKTADKIRRAFKGFFAVIEIGWEIFKGIAGLIGGVISALVPAGDGMLNFAANTGDTISRLNAVLVEGGGIQRFFERIGEVISGAFERIRDVLETPIAYLIAFKDLLMGLFEGGVPGATVVEESIGRVSDRLDVFGRMWERLEGIRDILGRLWDYISTWFSDLGSRLAETFSAGDFDEAVDLVNVGLLGGIIVMIRRFMNGFDGLDFGSGIVSRIRDALTGVTETLQAMQTNLRAQALMRIAIALGILTAAVVVLSLIDSTALTKALTAMAVGFGQLMAAMAVMSSSGFGVGAARMIGMSAAMILLATAVGVLSIAVTNLSQLDWSELARGLIGVTVALTAITASTQLIAADTTGLVRAGVAMIGISIALLVLSAAVKSFAEMSWEEMAQGLVGVGVGLGILTTALNFMPTEQLSVSATGILIISGALWVLAQAVEAFSTMSWSEMGQGLLGVAGGLAAIVLAMRMMPTQQLAVSATGILVISAAMYVMAQAVQAMAALDFGDMAQGIGGLAATLIILAVAMNVMNGTAAGAASLLLVSGALVILADVLKELGSLSLQELAIGLGAMAAVFVVIGLAALFLAPLAPALQSLAIALALIGGAFALFGVGAYLVAKSFEALAYAGQAGVAVLIQVIGALIDALPAFLGALGEALIESVTEILEAAPLLIDALRVILIKILETAQELIPQMSETFVEIVLGALQAVRELFPELVSTGAEMFLTFLRGVRDNITEFTLVAIEILNNFITAITERLPMLVATGALMVSTFLTELAAHTEMIVQAGMTLLASLLQGIANNLYLVIDAAGNIIISFLQGIADKMVDIVAAGVGILMQFLRGIADNLVLVSTTVVDIIVLFLNTMAENYQRLFDAGFGLLLSFIRGIGENLILIVNVVGQLVTEFLNALDNAADDVLTAGVNMLVDFLDGIARAIPRIAESGTDVLVAFINAIDDNSLRVVNAAAEMLIDFLNGLADAIEEYMPDIMDAGGRIAGALLDGMTGGIAGGIGNVVGEITDGVGGVVDGALGALGIGGPSKVFCEIGKAITAGMADGINRGSGEAIDGSKGIAKRTIDAFNDILSKVPVVLGSMDEFNPTITPVLDLTKVQVASKGLADMMAVPTITPEVSYSQARTIATTSEIENTPETPAYAGPSEVTFEQNIFAPKALSTNDIYRNTKSQIALAKEELKIS